MFSTAAVQGIKPQGGARPLSRPVVIAVHVRLRMGRLDACVRPCTTRLASYRQRCTARSVDNGVGKNNNTTNNPQPSGALPVDPIIGRGQHFRSIGHHKKSLLRSVALESCVRLCTAVYGEIWLLCTAVGVMVAYGVNHGSAAVASAPSRSENPP